MFAKIILSCEKTGHCCIGNVRLKFVDRKIGRGRRRKYTHDTPIAFSETKNAHAYRPAFLVELHSFAT